MATIETKRPGDPQCICGAFHLDFSQDEIDEGEVGHCMCGCHGSGEHIYGAPCPCNTERKEVDA